MQTQVDVPSSDSANPATSSPGGTSAALTLAALGVVYGDIGTSPLYALERVI